MTNNGIAYLLWLTGFFGLSGIHRLYLGKPISGIFYLCTLGVFGFGQVIDLMLIPGMVNEKNLKYRALHGSPYAPHQPQVVVNVGEDYQTPAAPPAAATPQAVAERLEVKILRICRDLGGATISDCVIETGAAVADIKDLLHRLSVDGVLVVDNREADGAVIYRAI